MKKWTFLRKNSRPIRNSMSKFRLAVEELEVRLTPSTDVTSYHPAIPTNNPPSTINAGVDSTETVLTPANVNSTTFGKLFSTTVDGQVYAQPLYMENVAIPGQGTHNVVFVATEHDSLYAIDSTTGAVLWHDVLLTAAHGGTTSSVPASVVGSSDISPEIGITATPVIDPNNNTIFVEAKQQEVAGDGTHYEHYLYAINIGSGAITNKVLIADSIGDTVVSGPAVNGNGAGSSGGVVKFDSLRQMERPGLTLINGNIYLAYASHGDNGPYHGWILGYSESSLTATAVFNVNPNGSDDGIWQSGGTLAYETVNGNTYLYFETGNGSFDTSLTQSPFNSNLMIPSGGDYGDSFVKVQIDGTTAASGSLDATNNINGWGMHVVDYFTPSNEGNLSNGDTDLGSGAPLLLPSSAGSAAHPNLMVGSGKEGRLYLIDRNNMGGYHGDAAGDGNTGFDNVVQETVTGAVNGSLDTPVYYNGLLYYVGGYGDVARTFSIANGVMSSSSTTQSTDSYPFPGSTPTISTNNGSNAIVWDIAGPGTSQLRAYSAANGYSTEIYTSAQAANSRDSLGSAVKFTVPTVADGEVFVGTTNSLVVYGLIQQATAPPAAPTNLTATAFSGSVINLAWTDHDTPPNTASAYNIFESTGGGAYTQVGTASAGATSFAVGGLSVSTTYSFEVSASNSKGSSAFTNVATATTTNQLSPLDFSSGFAGSTSLLTYNGSAKLNGTSAELTDGGGTEAGSVFSTNAVDVTKFSTQFTFQLTNAQADGFTFTIQGNGPTALGATGGGLGFQGLNNSVAVKFDLYNNNGEGTDSTGLFTNGAAPFTPSIDLSGTGLQLNSGDVFKVTMTYDGANLNVTITDTNTNQSASQSYAVNIPQVIGSNTGYVGFTGGTGGLTAVQNILTWAYSPTASTLPAAPSNLTGTVISGNEVDISWTDNSNNETGFLIDRSTDGGNTYSQIASVGANVTSYHDTSLSPGETVSYKVQSTNAAGNSAFSNVFTATVAIPPTPPANLHATNITATEVDLAWTNVATNATGIKILKQLGTNNSQVVATGLAPTTSSYNITGLTPGSNYTFEVDALNSSGPSGAATLAVDTLPAQVTGATATGGAGEVTISWAADQGAVTYNVYRSTTSGSFAATPTWSGITGTSYIDATATPGTTYYYEVSAVDPDAASPTDTAGESVKSAQVSGVAQAGGGINFGSGFAGATGLTLNGSAVLNGSSVELTNGGGSQAGSAFDNTAQNISTFSTQFTFQITGGSNPTADGMTFTIQGNSPTALGPSGGGLGYGPDNTGGSGGIPNSLAIKFDLYSNQGEGVDSTGLYTGGAAPTNIGSLDMTGSVDLHSGDVMQVNLGYDGSNLTETIKDLTTGGTFTHTYTGVNIAGVVGGSTAYVGFTGGTGGLTAVQNIQSWTFTPGASSSLGAPSNLVGTIQNGPQVQLTWNDNSTAETGFSIQRATDAAFSQNVTTFSVGANTTTDTDTSIVAGTTYYYRVQAVQGSTGSAFSNPVTEAIPSPPTTPSNGHATFISATEIDLAWTNNATNATEIDIFREVVGSSFTQIATLSPTATSYQDTGLTPGTNYDYHIVAANVSGFADQTGANVYTVSPAITNLAATAGTGQIALSWSAPAGSPITTYNVYRGTSAGGESATAIATGLTSTSFTDTGVTAGTTYFYEVTSVDPNSQAPPSAPVAPFGESARSNEVSAAPTATGLPAPWVDADIGSPGIAGSASSSNGTFTVNGGGGDIWNTADQFNYVYQAVSGNETIIARVASQQNTDPWAKAGVMVRDSLSANAAYAFVHTTPGNGTDFQYRTADGASAQWNGQVSATAPEWVKLVINGGTITGYTSPDGNTWTQIGTITLPLGSTYYVGLADTAHNNGLISTDTFTNVGVTNQSGAVVGTGTGLTGQYYSDVNLQNLVVTRTDPTVNFTWANDTAPVSGLPADNWSVKWTGQVQAQYSEAYTFSTISDDGIRVFVNGQEIINDWTYHAATTDTSAPIQLVAGQKYSIEVDYFEGGGAATAQLFWSSPSTPQQIIPTSQLYAGQTAVIGTGTGLTGQYYSDVNLQNLVVTRTDPTVNFTWANDTAPVSGLPADNWSVKWTGQVQAQYSEAYTFSTISDDGIRVFVNGQEIINDWTYHAATTDSGSIALQAGQKYSIEVDYFEGGGAATAQLFWSSPSTPQQIIPTSQLYTANSAQAVNLAGSFNRVGMVSDGSTFSGGLDGGGSALSANLLGSSVSWNGQTFALGTANTNNVVSAQGQTISLPAGNFSTLSFLAAGVNGNQAGLTFTVTYTDGTTQTFTQSISDWFTPQGYSGESIAASTAYRDTSGGGRDSRTFNVYGYSFALNNGKTVQSITLPNNGNVEILAMTLR